MYSGFDFLVSGTLIRESRFRIHSKNSGFLVLNSRFQSAGFWISLHGASKYSSLSLLLARSADAGHFFIGTSLCCLCSTSTWNFLFWSCMEDLNTWQQLILSLPKLWCGPKYSSPAKFTYMCVWHNYFQESWHFGTKFEKCESIISSDVFAAVAIIVAKAPLGRLLESTDKSCTW